jgi:hypothetical protein
LLPAGVSNEFQLIQDTSRQQRGGEHYHIL